MTKLSRPALLTTMTLATAALLTVYTQSMMTLEAPGSVAVIPTPAGEEWRDKVDRNRPREPLVAAAPPTPLVQHYFYTPGPPKHPSASALVSPFQEQSSVPMVEPGTVNCSQAGEDNVCVSEAEDTPAAFARHIQRAAACKKHEAW